MKAQQWEADLPVLYNTLAIYQRGLDHPLNDWLPPHSRQGFSWRPGSVSFRTLDLDTITDPVIVEVSTGYMIAPSARRVIRVPFEVGDRGVEVTSPVMDAWPLDVPPGQYALFFAIEPVPPAEQNVPGEVTWRYHLTLVSTDQNVEPKILQADEELDASAPLLMEAQPAME